MESNVIFSLANYHIAGFGVFYYFYTLIPFFSVTKEF